MKLSISNFLTSYGRYISRYRAIPYYIDCLLPVERRILIISNKIDNGKLVKSAKVVGSVIGELHPHGDGSVYGTLQKLVHQKLIIGQGNWGSSGLNDDSAAAMRYTECKIAPWVTNFAFKYIKYAPMDPDPEYNPEPLALPCPIPLGLIGTGIISGIAYHRPVIPKYKKEDLAKRLKWILDNENTISNFDDIAEFSEDVCGPLIKPNFKNCECRSKTGNDKEFYSILFTGVGKLQAVPHGKKIDNKSFEILGRSPTRKDFDNLIAAIKDKKLELKVTDLSSSDIKINCHVSKRGLKIDDVITTVWNKYLITNINFSVLVVNDNGTVEQKGIDELLINCYYYWMTIVKHKRLTDIYKLFEKKVSIHCILTIRDILEKHPEYKHIDEFLDYYKTNFNNSIIIKLEEYDYGQDCWNEYDYNITINEIDKECSGRTIKNLLNSKTDITAINQEIVDAKKKFANTEIDCYNEICNMCK